MTIQSQAPSQASTIVDVLQSRAAEAPDNPAFCFLVNGEEEGPRLSYGALDCLARGLAVRLRDGAEPGDRALLLYEPGLHFIPAFFGCLYAGLIPVPLCPPRAGRIKESWAHVARVAADCRPRWALTTGDRAVSLTKGLGVLADGDVPRWLATNEVDSSPAQHWREVPIDPDAVAYLQYTSGSTAAPKGVIVSHGNLLHNQQMIGAAMEHPVPARAVCWLPLYHDMGLVGFVLHTVFHGALTYLMPPVSLVQQPFRWLQALSRYRAHASGGPNIAYDLCLECVTPQQREALDLRDWGLALVGAEPVSARTLERFSEAFAPCGFRADAFYPTYGLAEATLFVTGGSKAARPTVRTVRAEDLARGRAVDAPVGTAGRTLVGCGRPWLGQQLLIVQPDVRVRCPEGTVGEIWLSGPSVAQGYWNQPEETERTFGAHLGDTGEGPFLRTGDLGFLRDGELFITGRLKDLLVIRGRNHYPQDIEATVRAVHSALRADAGAAFETGPDGQPQLVVVQEVDRRAQELDAVQLVGDIRQAVAEAHDLQLDEVLFLEPGSLPRTTSGKIQRHACRDSYERGTLRRWKGP